MVNFSSLGPRQLGRNIRLPSLVALACGSALLLTATTVMGDEQQQRKPPGRNVGTFKHTGTVVNAEDGRVAMTIAGGLPHTHRVAKDAKITLDGEPAKLEKLQKGDRIQVVSRVTMRPTPTGTVLSIDGPALEIKAERPKKPERQAEVSETEDVALGVAVAASPAGSPLVVALVDNSPAQKAGIQRGDYITSVDEKPIDSPAALRDAVVKKSSGESARLGIWRNGEELTLDVEFPAARDSEKSRELATKPWLGLMLETADEDSGALIAGVYLRSPAAKAGLLPGDRIVEVDGQPVDSPREAANQVQELEPGTESEITVVRDGDEKRVTIQVADLGDFHERLFGKAFREQFEDFHKLFDPDFDGVPEQLELFNRTN